MRDVTLCAIAMAAAGFAASAQQIQPPASYPHDMSEYGCSHRDVTACDTAPAPPPDYNPLVGTWVRYSLLRNGFSVQPPDAPLYVKFMNDGWWSMMEFPANRPKVNKPLEQQTPAELFKRFDLMGGGWGNYTNIGQVNIRHHMAGLGPGGGESDQERGWHFEGNILILDGTGPTRSPIVHARKLPNQPLGSKALVGSWERTSYSVNGVSGQPAPEHLLLGEDGWYHATVLPAGRKSAGGDEAKWTTQDYVAAYKGMQASRGTYNVQGNTFVRRHIADTDPNLEDKLSTGTFAQQGDTFTWTGTDAAGQKFEASYRRLKPFDVYAPMPARGRGAAPAPAPAAPARGRGAQ
jgi:hypothetical protein